MLTYLFHYYCYDMFPSALSRYRFISGSNINILELAFEAVIRLIPTLRIDVNLPILNLASSLGVQDPFTRTIKYLASSDDEAPIEDQPLPADASPIALSLDYVPDSDLEEDPNEDPKEDHADYIGDGGDRDDEPSDDDDDDDDD
ncbi:hypothetical protein Tco_1356277 [Tanacetum coccineum]